MPGKAASQIDLSSKWVNPARVLWAGPLTLLASVIVVVIIRLIAIHILMPDPDSQPLAAGPPILDTVLVGGAAVYVFFGMASYNPSPPARYRSLAWKILIVSFVPDVLVALRHSWGGGWPEVFALMTMHVTVWTFCLTMLPALTEAPNRSGIPPLRWRPGYAREDRIFRHAVDHYLNLTNVGPSYRF